MWAAVEWVFGAGLCNGVEEQVHLGSALFIWLDVVGRFRFDLNRKSGECGGVFSGQSGYDSIFVYTVMFVDKRMVSDM